MEKEKNIKELEEELSYSSNKAIESPEDFTWSNELRSCADLYRMYQNKQLEIQPEFQRYFVWKPTVQTRFIDSLMKQLPIPSLFIGKDYKTENQIVIDGQQRISTIVKFFEDKKWRLKLPDIDVKKSGIMVSEIKQKFPGLYARVENATIPVTFVRCDFSKQSHMDDLFKIFNRLNTGGLKLNNQEIRNCIFSGGFNNLLREVAFSEQWKNSMGKTSKVNRFENEEIILRTFAFNEKLDDYDGNLARFLNRYMAEKKDIPESEIQEKRNILFTALSFIYDNLDEPEKVHKLGKTVKEGLLVGISQNITGLISKSKDEFQSMYANFRNDDEFSENKLKQGLSKKENVQPRLRKSISIFGS